MSKTINALRSCFGLLKLYQLPYAKTLCFSGVSSLLCSGLRIATWLILPVVICLSQRLSHACLSVNNFILWNCEWLIKSVIVYLMVSYYLDNRSNSRANTCTKSRLLEGMYLLDTEPTHSGGFWWFIITSRIALLYAGDDSFKFLPYQLSMVG